MGTASTVAILLWSLISYPVNAVEPIEHSTHGAESFVNEGHYADHRFDRELREQSTLVCPEHRIDLTGTEGVGMESKEKPDGKHGKNRVGHQHVGRYADGRASVRNAKWIGAGVTLSLSLLGALIMWESSRATSRRKTS